jgi:hypothetical protein
MFMFTELHIAQKLVLHRGQFYIYFKLKLTTSILLIANLRLTNYITLWAFYNFIFFAKL